MVPNSVQSADAFLGARGRPRRDRGRDQHEFVLAIIGGLFVVEALSVVIQVGYYKRTRKRVLLMAPIHHHFEKKGWAEPQIVIRCWIVSLILATIGLATLKLRRTHPRPKAG